MDFDRDDDVEETALSDESMSSTAAAAFLLECE